MLNSFHIDACCYGNPDSSIPLLRWVSKILCRSADEGRDETSSQTIRGVVKVKKIWVIGLLVLILSVGTASALTAVSVTHRVFDAMVAGNQNVTGNISATDQGFFPILGGDIARGASIATAVVFPGANTGVSANTALTAGDWRYTVFLQPTASTPVSTTFSVVLQVSRFAGCCPNLVSPLAVYVATGATVDPTSAISVSFDIGPDLPTPVAYLVTVAPV